MAHQYSSICIDTCICKEHHTLYIGCNSVDILNTALQMPDKHLLGRQIDVYHGNEKLLLQYVSHYILGLNSLGQ